MAVSRGGGRGMGTGSDKAVFCQITQALYPGFYEAAARVKRHLRIAHPSCSRSMPSRGRRQSGSRRGTSPGPGFGPPATGLLRGPAQSMMVIMRLHPVVGLARFVILLFALLVTRQRSSAHEGSRRGGGAPSTLRPAMAAMPGFALPPHRLNSASPRDVIISARAVAHRSAGTGVEAAARGERLGRRGS
jgi:hypothetical protein